MTQAGQGDLADAAREVVAAFIELATLEWSNGPGTSPEAGHAMWQTLRTLAEVALGTPCCDPHGAACEPGELCCRWCPEQRHPAHYLEDRCVLEPGPGPG